MPNATWWQRLFPWLRQTPDMPTARAWSTGQNEGWSTGRSRGENRDGDRTSGESRQASHGYTETIGYTETRPREEGQGGAPKDG